MRKLFALLFVLATIIVVPVVPAAAQVERVDDFVIIAEEFPAGVAADGATLTAGTYTSLIEGVVIDVGTIEGRYYDRGTGVHGTRRFVSDVNGLSSDTQVKALIVDVDDSGDPVVVTYLFSEEVVASTGGFVGSRGRGVAVFSGFADGSFVLETTGEGFLVLG